MLGADRFGSGGRIDCWVEYAYGHLERFSDVKRSSGYWRSDGFEVMFRGCWCADQSIPVEIEVKVLEQVPRRGSGKKKSIL